MRYGKGGDYFKNRRLELYFLEPEHTLTFFFYFSLAGSSYGNGNQTTPSTGENGVYGILEERWSLLWQVNSSLRMGTERSLRSEVKY